MLLAVGKGKTLKIQELLQKMDEELILAQLEVDLRGRWEMFKILPPEEQWRLIEETGLELEKGKKTVPAKKAASNILEPVTARASIGFKKRYDELIKEWAGRLPVIKDNYLDVQKAYNSDAVFSIAGESHQKVLGEVQESLRSAMADGKSENDWIKEAPEHWPKFRASMSTIFRTNLSTAYAAGRIAAAKGTNIVGFKRLSVRDGSARESHEAADGLLWSLDPDWDDRGIGYFSLPWGYNERCTDRPITKMEARRMGHINNDGRFFPPKWPDTAHPDPGFENSPVERIYNG